MTATDEMLDLLRGSDKAREYARWLGATGARVGVRSLREWLCGRRDRADALREAASAMGAEIVEPRSGDPFDSTRMKALNGPGRDGEAVAETVMPGAVHRGLCLPALVDLVLEGGFAAEARIAAGEWGGHVRRAWTNEQLLQ